eukprot:CAMPEP_0119009056 /NCGR_PEP_ID=MMETSP1176-20130426/4114_1 /TAXON_ID=265551 /ORGANISM="Synedropsis recta cf, Strain CCMP1620" /LENGTH=676 /DNA_ID=CAMNT_0006961501 /DNA_START=47 /DNA_END=2077 /DNA_ORIENTATION=-
MAEEARATMVALPPSASLPTDDPFDDTESIHDDDDDESIEVKVEDPPQEVTKVAPAPAVAVAAGTIIEEESNTTNNDQLLLLWQQKQITEDIVEENNSVDDNDDEEMILPTSVTVDRKRDLLREARADRVAWIQTVPLPYTITTTGSSTTSSSVLDTTHIVKELPSATKILTHLYGCHDDDLGHLQRRVATLIPKVDDDDDDNNNNNIITDPAIRTGDEVLDDERKDCPSDDLQRILTDYQTFCHQLKQPESAVVVNGIRNSIQRLGSDPATALRHYVASTLEQLKRCHPPHNQKHQEWTKRSLESFLYGQAHKKIIATLTKERLDDETFHEKLKTLSFVSAKHLDLTCFVVDGDNDDDDDNKKVNHLAAAVSALLSMQNFHAPYEKLQQILKSYHCVNAALKAATDGNLIPSADDVLPTLILTVLQAQPHQIVSNLRMVEVYSPPEYLRGEAGYAYTNLYGAVQFLQELELKKDDAADDDDNDDQPMTSLTMTSQEFRAGLKASRAVVEAQLLEKAAANPNKSAIVVATLEPPAPIEIPVAQVRAARLRGEVINVEWARQQFVVESGTADKTAGEGTSEQDNTNVPPVLPPGFTRNYAFLTTRPEEIRLSDLPQLLTEYRMLVRTTETLLAERAQRSSMERKERLLQAEKAIQESALHVELLGQLKKNTRSSSRK